MRGQRHTRQKGGGAGEVVAAVQSSVENGTAWCPTAVPPEVTLCSSSRMQVWFARVLPIMRNPWSEPSGATKSEQTVFPAFSADRALHAAKIADDIQGIPVAVLNPAQVQRHDTDDEEKTRGLATADPA